MILRWLGMPTAVGRTWSCLAAAVLLTFGGSDPAPAGTVHAPVPGGPVLAGVDHDLHDHITINADLATSTTPGVFCFAVSYSFSSHHDWEITSAVLTRHLADSPVGTNPLRRLDEWSTTVDTEVNLNRDPSDDCTGIEPGVRYRYEVAATFGALRSRSQDPGPATREIQYHVQPNALAEVRMTAPTPGNPFVKLDWDEYESESLESGYGPISGYAVQYRIDSGAWQDADPPHSGGASNPEYRDTTAWKLPRTTMLEYRVRLRTSITERVEVGANVWKSPMSMIARTTDAPSALTVTAPQTTIQLADPGFPPARLEWGAATDMAVRYQVFRRPIDGSNAPFTVRATELSRAHFEEDQARTGDTYEYRVQAYSYTGGGSAQSAPIRLTFVPTPARPSQLRATAAEVTGLFGSTFRIEGPPELLPSQLHEFRITMTAGQALLGGRQRGVLFHAGDGALARWVDADNLGACTGVLFCPVRLAGADYGFHPTDGQPSQWLAYWRGFDTITGLRSGDAIQVLVPPEVSAMHTVEFGFGQVAESGTPDWFTDINGVPSKQTIDIQPITLTIPHSLTASRLSRGRVRLNWMAEPGSYDGFQVQRRPASDTVEPWGLVCCQLGLNTRALVDTPPTPAPGATTRYEYRVGTFYAGGRNGWLGAAAQIDLASTAAAIQQRPSFPEAARNPSHQFTVGATVDQTLPTATGGNAPLTYRFTDLSAVGLRFDATAHKLLGTTVAGSVHGTLSVQDSDGDRDELWYEITVGDLPTLPRSLTAMGGVQANTLNWQAPATLGSVTTLSGYRIESSPDSTLWQVLVDQTATDATSYVHAGLAGAQAVYYRVAAISVVGMGPYSNVWRATTDPATEPLAPASVTATPDFREVVLDWTLPERDGGASITGYRLEQSATGADDDWQLLLVLEPARPVGDQEPEEPPRTYTVSNLRGGQVMHFRVAAINSVGTGAYVATYTTPWAAPRPDAPTALVATPDTQRIRLSWTAPRTVTNVPILGYRIEQSTTGEDFSWETLSSDTRSPNPRFAHDGLALSQTVYYQVAAITYGGVSDFSRSASATTLAEGVPGELTGIEANSYTASVRLDWGAPVSDGGSSLTGYLVQSSATGGDPWTDAQASSTADHYIHTGLAAGQQMYFRVAAVNTHGNGPFTPIVNQRAIDGLPPYTEAPDVAARVEDEILIVVFNYTWPGASRPHPSSVQWEYSFDRWSGWRRYFTSQFIKVDQQNSHAKREDTRVALRPGHATYFRMRYCIRNGCGPWGTTRWDHPEFADPPARAPDAPRNLRAQRGYRSVDLAWQEPFDGGVPLTTYQVRYSPDGTNWTTTEIDSVVPEYTVTGLAHNTEHRFLVAAKNALGDSAYTDELRIRTVPQGTLPDPPIQLQAEFGARRVELSWQPPAVDRGAVITGFRVEYSTDGPTGTWTPVVTTPDATTLTHTHTGLPNAQEELHYRAFTVADVGESIASAVVRVADTPAAPPGILAFGGRDSVLLEWAPPGEYIGPRVESYRVQHRSGAHWLDAAPPTGSGASRRLIIPNLADGQTREYRVVAENRIGIGAGSLSASATVSQQRPSPPRNVAASTHGDNVEVRWLPPSIAGEAGDRIIGYRVDRSVDGGMTWSTLTANTEELRPNYVDTNVVPNTTAMYRAFALNSRTHSLSLPGDRTPVAVDSAPALPPVTVTAELGFAHSEISWEEVSALGGVAVSGYRVEYAMSDDAADADWQALPDLLSADITEVRHDPLPAQDAIYYRVATRTAMGNSRYSVVVGGPLLNRTVVLDLNGNGEPDGDDMQVLYYALALNRLLGNGNATSGFAPMREALLIDVPTTAAPNTTPDERYRLLLTAAGELTGHVSRLAFDLNRDNNVNEDDALILYYVESEEFTALLGDGTSGSGDAAMRQTFLAPLAGTIVPTDDNLRDLLNRANILMGN